MRAVAIIMTKKNIITILILAILLAALPLGIKLVREQQILRSRALEGTAQIEFVTEGNPNIVERAGRKVLKVNPNTNTARIGVKFTSPFGPAPSGAGQISPTPTPTPTISPSPTPSPGP